MRTTLNLDDDLVLALKDRARREKVSLGEVVSRLLRDALSGKTGQPGVAEPEAFYGIEPLPARDTVVSNELIDRLRDEEGI
ncbi:MAG: CopG family transcriptional regulator [Pseudomonadota bacterium]